MLTVAKLSLLLSLGLLPTIALGASIQVDFLRLVMHSDAAILGSVMETEPFDSSAMSRYSWIEVDHVLFGLPASLTVRVRWAAETWEAEPGVWIMRGCGTRAQLDRHPGRCALWLLKETAGELGMYSSPLWLDELDSAQVSRYLASLDRAPREDWHRYLSAPEALEYEQPVLAVRNYLTWREGDSVIASNGGSPK